MNQWEGLVQTYLTVDRRMFVNPQYEVGGKTWTACLDFLALDFANKTVWVVEVSKGRSGFADRAAQFDVDYLPRIRHQLTHLGQGTLFDDSWKVGLWLFSSVINLGWCDKLLSKFEVAPRKVTALENVAEELLNGKAWNDRRDCMPEIEEKRDA